MMHGIRVSMSKGVAKKHLLKQDESLTATETALDAWRASMTNLLDAMNKNEQAWQALFSTYSSLQAIGTCIYSPRDTGVLTFLKELKETESLLEVPVEGLEPVFNARQRVLIAKQELAGVLEQIDKTYKLHLERFEAIRQHKYYDDKTRQMLAAEAKRKPQPKEVERRVRNQNKAAELQQNVVNISNKLFSELESVNTKRLAVTDGALAALVYLQKHHFAHNPIKPAVLSAEKIGLGVRTLQIDPGFWVPSPNSSQNAPHVPSASHDTLPPQQQSTYGSPSYNGELHGPNYPNPQMPFMATAPPTSPPLPPNVADYVSPVDSAQPSISSMPSYEQTKTPRYSNAIA